MTYNLKYNTSDIVCNTLQSKDINESFLKCVEDDIQILEWIRNTSFEPNEELDEKLKQMKEMIEKYYLQALIGINEFGVKNVFNRALGYKIMLINEIVELLRKYQNYQ